VALADVQAGGAVEVQDGTAVFTLFFVCAVGFGNGYRARFGSRPSEDVG
jgi:hypothetical protein